MTRPKALVEVGGKTLIDHMLDRLREVGAKRFVVNVHAFADRLEAHLLGRSDLDIVISDERETLLETGGGLKKAAPVLGADPIWVANIDSVWVEDHQNRALKELAASWDAEAMDAVLLLARMDRTTGFDGAGDFFMDGDNRLTFRNDAPAAPLNYMGVHITKPSIVAAVPRRCLFTQHNLAAVGAARPVARCADGGRLDACRRPGGARYRRDPAGPVSQPRDIFAWAGPRWYTIPSGRCFLDDLALGLCQSLGDDLPAATILTPTRRGARQMAQAFSQQARGKALLLPQVRAIGDLDEGEPPFDLEALGLDLPPALSPLRRRFELARLITEHYEGFEGRTPSGKLALELADSLAGFFDSLALEEVDAADKLEGLVRGDGADEYTLAAWAEHWQVSARFLAIAVRRWPERLLELERMDPSQRQVVLIRRLADQWRDRPPATPLILAGTTGSAPSTADLADIVARAPLGAVVLPGLDLSLADNAWRQIEDSHPQATMKRLLDRHRVPRDGVREWPASTDADRKARARRRLINEALRPAAATADWRDQIAALKQEDERAVEDGLDGLFEIHSARDEEAASAIALPDARDPGNAAAGGRPDHAGPDLGAAGVGATDALGPGGRHLRRRTAIVIADRALSGSICWP